MGESLCLQLWFSGTHTIDHATNYTAIVLCLCLLYVQLQHSYKKLYLILDNGSLTFTGDPHEVLLFQYHNVLCMIISLSPLSLLPSPSLFPSLPPLTGYLLLG